MTERGSSEEFTVELGRRVRRLREAAGLDLAEASRLSGLSPAEIEAIEQGAEPLLSELLLLAGAFRVKPSCLLDVARWIPMTPEDPDGGYLWTNRVDDA